MLKFKHQGLTPRLHFETRGGTKSRRAQNSTIQEPSLATVTAGSYPMAGHYAMAPTWRVTALVLHRIKRII